MAAIIIDPHQSSLPAQFNPRTTRFQLGPSAYMPAPNEPIPPHNNVELTRDMLITILEYFSQLVAQLFTGRTIRMVVHGGACMLLHPALHQLESQQQHRMIPSLPRRTTTRDVNYIHRSFVSELALRGMPDAAIKIQECIKTTARHFGLGAHWMNGDTDTVLPIAHDPSGNFYDPIYIASIKENNIDINTIFRSANGLLTLISVTPFWAVLLKLVRYTKWDPGDICLLLRHGMVLSGTSWTPETVEKWLFRNPWAMRYYNFDTARKEDLRARIVHAIQVLSKWSSAVQPPERRISAHDAMDGGEYRGNKGWSYSFGTWPNQVQHPQAQASSTQFHVPAPAPVPVSVRNTGNSGPQQQRNSRAPSPYSPQTPDPTSDNWDSTPSSIKSFDQSINLMLRQDRHPNATAAESPWHTYAQSTSTNHLSQTHIAPPMPPLVTHISTGLQSPPLSLGPAQLAQYQFERQQREYQLQQQQRLQQQQKQQQQQQQQSVRSRANVGVTVYPPCILEWVKIARRTPCQPGDANPLE